MSETITEATDLARLQKPHPLTSPARFAFDSEQLALIKRTVARGAPDAELLLFLELISRYRLDPFVGHAYLVQMPGRDGASGPWTTIVSRDGLLSMANRESVFQGMEGDVVRKGDIIARSGEGFIHTYPGIEASERMSKPIVGAWNRVYRSDRPLPTFFFAPFVQYVRGAKPWKQYPDAMILKVAESMSLRKAFSITGLVSEDEVGASYEPGRGATVVEGTAVDTPEEPDWGDDPELASRLQVAISTANELRPGSFRPQKVRLQLAGATQEDRLRVAEQVEQFIERHRSAEKPTQ